VFYLLVVVDNRDTRRSAAKRLRLRNGHPLPVMRVSTRRGRAYPLPVMRVSTRQADTEHAQSRMTCAGCLITRGQSAHRAGSLSPRRTRVARTTLRTGPRGMPYLKS
jgi:hypothetical protein